MGAELHPGKKNIEVPLDKFLNTPLSLTPVYIEAFF